MEKKAVELGEFVLKDRSIKGLLKKATGNDPEAKKNLETLMQQQFNQRFVTAGIVDLVMPRIYDKKLKTQAQAVKGFANPPPHRWMAL